MRPGYLTASSNVEVDEMGLGLGIVLIVIGAIVRWAITVHIQDVNNENLGLILIVVGIISVVLSLIQMEQLRRRRNVTTVDDRRDPMV